MSEDKNTTNTEVSELEELKTRADALGIDYSANIGVATLTKRIEEFLGESTPTVSTEPDNKRLPVNQQLRKEANKLHRVIITCLDPMYSSYSSKIFQVGNRVVGTIKRAVPFGKPFHVPAILLKQIESETFVKHSRVNSSANGGMGDVKREDVPRYGIKHLSPLNTTELNDLNSALKASNK